MDFVNAFVTSTTICLARAIFDTEGSKSISHVQKKNTTKNVIQRDMRRVNQHLGFLSFPSSLSVFQHSLVFLSYIIMSLCFPKDEHEARARFVLYILNM